MATGSRENLVFQNLCYLSSPNVTERQNAEAFMKLMEKQRNFSIFLLQILENQSVDYNFKYPAAIVLNNFIKTSWAIEYPEPAIVKEEKWIMKEKLPQLAIVSHRNIASFLRDMIKNIVQYETLDHFPALSMVLSKCGQLDDPYSNLMILELAHSLCKKYRIQIKSESLWSEIRTILDSMASSINGFAQLTVNSLPRDYPMNGNTVNMEIVQMFCRLWMRLLDVYHDLIFQELPEEFVKTLGLWIALFYKILTDCVFDINFITDSSLKQQIVLLLSKMKLKVIRILNLFINKYEADIKIYVKDFIPLVYNTVSNIGRANEKLSSACIKFFSQISSTRMFRDLLSSQDDIRGLCLCIVKPNIVLTEYDYEMFEFNPGEYISRDLDRRSDGSNRQAVIDLISNLMAYSENMIVNLLTNEIKNMIANSTSGSGNQFCVRDVGSVDSAIFLLSAILIKKRHPLKGVLQVNSAINLSDYFENLIFPILMSSEGIKPIIVADALKFVYTFYKFMNKDFISRVLPIVLRFFTTHNEILFTYLCLLLTEIYSEAKGSGPSFYLDIIEKNLDDVLLTVVNKVLLNEYCCQLLVKMLLYYNVSIRLETQQVILRQLIHYISNIQSNVSPSNIRVLFECVSISMWMSKAADTNYFSTIEMDLLNIIVKNIRNINPGSIDYYYQLFGLLLKLHTSGNIENTYHQIILEFLNPDFCVKNTCASGLCIVIGDYASSFNQIAFGPDAYQALVTCFKICLSRPQDDRFSYIIPKAFITRAPMNEFGGLFNQIFMFYAEKFNGRYTRALMKGFVHLVLQLYYISDEGVVMYALNMMGQDFYLKFLSNILYFELIGDCTDNLYRKLVEMLGYFAISRSISSLRVNQTNLWCMLLNVLIASVWNNREILDRSKIPANDHIEGDIFNRLTYCATSRMPFSPQYKLETKFITTDVIRNFDIKAHISEIIHHADVFPNLQNILHESNKRYIN